jgi:hypothetical protein
MTKGNHCHTEVAKNQEAVNREVTHTYGNNGGRAFGLTASLCLFKKTLISVVHALTLNNQMGYESY